MSSSLFIGYARATCDRAQVQTILTPIFGLIDRIDETTRKDSKGYDYKMFFIHFKVTTPELSDAISRIRQEDFINVVYDTQWDKRKWNEDTHNYGAEVKRWWKVTLYVKKDKITPEAPCSAPPSSAPHIMSVEEAALIRAPKIAHNDDGSHIDSSHIDDGFSEPSRRRKRNSA